MIYKISNKQERKSQTTGKEYVSATLTDEQGREYAGINAFNGEFNVSDTWHGELQQNGQYYNLVSPKMASGNNFKTAQVEKTMQRKEDSIARFQDTKEQSIKMASTLGKAVEIAIAEYSNPNNLYTMQELIEKWRRYLWSEWENTSQYPPFG